MVIKKTILIDPVGKARPRGMMRGGRSVFYTPSKTAHAENIIRDQVMELKEFYDHGVPLRLEATFIRERPKRLKKTVLLPVTRPDWDNYGKLLTDALEKFAYANDSQITTAVIKKRFGAPPRIELTIEEDIVEVLG